MNLYKPSEEFTKHRDFGNFSQGHQDQNGDHESETLLMSGENNYILVLFLKTFYVGFALQLDKQYL